MRLSSPTAPGGFWLAADRREGIEVRFVGRGPRSSPSEVVRLAGGDALEPSWCRQVHSADCVEARPGECGEGDALITTRRGRALMVATADCVPVVVGDAERLAVIHAGWRGIAAGIVSKAISHLGGEGSRTAWIGPAIGPCCYEVGPEVARTVVEASASEVLSDGPRGRPHLDLAQAVAIQLRSAGLSEIRVAPECTRCSAASLWSYRRDGSGAGRNWTFAWLS